ncbi:UNVERIFIED_CONTAM: putative calcium-binding protein CML41 [Sesamum latifolium]|uniref:Calcium-binding protein CML41 n=1 Tax=Sesamum latifolium TaxID=2727402 RepID=A0AAW2VS62_9LAMI
MQFPQEFGPEFTNISRNSILYINPSLTFHSFQVPTFAIHLPWRFPALLRRSTPGLSSSASPAAFASSHTPPTLHLKPPAAPTEDSTSKTSTSEDEFRRVFSFLDADSDGKISAEELRDYFDSIGESLSYDDAKRIIGEFSNGSLLLGYGEFVRLMELRDGDGDVVLRQAFEVYEVEKGSGFITPEGLRQVLRRLGDVKSLQECKAMIRVYDLDGNGVLDFHEFYKMMT